MARDLVGKEIGIDPAGDVMPGGKLPAVAAREGTQVQSGDFVRTKSNSRAELTFNDGSVVKIAQRSRIDVGALRLPAWPSERRISGVVVATDGTPAPTPG